MIVIRVALETKPENRRQLIAELRAEAAEARSLAGCVRFDLFQDTADSNKFLLYEEWRDLTSFDAYKGSALFAETGRKVFPLLAGKPDSAYYEGNRLEPA